MNAQGIFVHTITTGMTQEYSFDRIKLIQQQPSLSNQNHECSTTLYKLESIVLKKDKEREREKMKCSATIKIH